MKKKLFFLPLVAAMMLSACSDDEPGVNGGSEGGGDGQFLAINIVSNGGAASRADGIGDQYTGENGKSQFEDGLEDENTVKDVRIYFFSASGDAVSVKKGSDVNYYDIPTSLIATNDSSENQGETVEKILKAVVIVEKGEKLPAKVVAVLNPDKTNLGETSLSLTALQDKFNNYSKLANAAAPQFVMTNSVYVDVNSKIVATNVSASNYASTKEGAEANPVEIYVERAVAKVRLSAGSLDTQTATDGSTLYKLYKAVRDEKGNYVSGTEELKIGEGTNAKQVYLKMLGWDVTADLVYGNLIKDVDDTWPSDYLGSDVVWNRPAYHRSYWARICNPTGESNTNQYFAYNATGKFVKTKFDGNEAVYCNENAERTGGLNLEPTKVIIKGTICDVDGNPVVITEYGGNRVVDDENFTALKYRYITVMAASKAELPWRKVTQTDGTVKYVQLTPEELTMKAVEYINPSDIDAAKASSTPADNGSYDVDNGRYYVYPCLTGAAEKYTWFANVRYGEDGKTIVEGKTLAANDINKMLLGLSHAKVWKNGMTYYFVNIKHLGKKGLEGVVRNHIYDLNLTKICGLGTPVYSEELTIIPEKPQNDETFIAARVNILSWRVVKNDVILDWD